MNSNPTNMGESEFIAYLAKHGITKYKKSSDGAEIAFPCPFRGCDDDQRRSEELHCCFNLEKCVYHCFKCGEKGNFITLRKHFNDYEKKTPTTKKRESLEAKAERWNKAMPEDMRLYLNARGIDDASIEKHKLGYGEYNRKFWITIPIFDKDGKVAYFKLRKRPDDESPNTPKYIVCPAGASIALCGIKELLESSSNDVLICEGEFDRIVTLRNGVNMPIITAGGANVFKDEWLPLLKDMRNIYICLDSDETGERASQNMIKLFSEKLPRASIFKISIPYDYGVKADLTDYFTTGQGTAERLFRECTEWVGGVEPIDESKFTEMGVDDIATVLSLTVKHDKVSKVVTFLAMLLAYTEDAQLNVMFNAASSTGKSYICGEISKLFPSNDVMSYGKTSPTAFYYNESLSREDPETGQMFIDLERKILIFTEQPDTSLLANLRSFLSHDSKRTKFSITNKGKNGANKSTDAYILGYASTFFCTANMRIDEQEQTRCLILSPESTTEKIKSAILATVIKNSDKEWFDNHVETNEDRQLLRDRILYIKHLNVGYIRIEDKEYLLDCFMKSQKTLQPRNSRDVEHFASLVKGMALVNAPFRLKEGAVVATKKDIDEAFRLWDKLSESMRLGIPPHVLDIYKRVIVPAYREINREKRLPENMYEGITFEELRIYYSRVNGSHLNMDMYRKNYIPILASASLIEHEADEADKRRKLIKPLVFFD